MTKKLQKISWHCLLFKATVLQYGFCHKQNPPNMLKLFGLRHDQTLRYCFFIFALDPYIQYFTSALVLFNPPFTNAHKKVFLFGLQTWSQLSRVPRSIRNCCFGWIWAQIKLEEEKNLATSPQYTNHGAGFPFTRTIFNININTHIIGYF